MWRKIVGIKTFLHIVVCLHSDIMFPTGVTLRHTVWDWIRKDQADDLNKKLYWIVSDIMRTFQVVGHPYNDG